MIRTLGRFLVCLAVLGAIAPAADADDDAWTHYPNMNRVTSLAESDTEIFVGTTGGIRRYDRFFDQWKSPLTTAEGLPSNKVRALSYDPNSSELRIDTLEGSGVWHTGLESFSFGGGSPDPPPPPLRIPPVTPPFGYYVDGYRVVGPRETYPITAAIIDSWDTLWLGTEGLGVGRARLSDEQLTFDRYGPIEDNVTALAREGDILWIGGGDLFRIRSEGVTRFDTEQDEWSYLVPESRSSDVADLRVTHILPQDDHVWFSTQNGLIRYHRTRERWDFFRMPRRISGGVRSLLRDGKRIWMATESGLALFDTEVDSMRFVEGSESFLISSLAANDDAIWAATDRGLYRCSRGSVRWEPVGDVLAITRRSMLAVAAARDGIWAAVESPPRVIRVTGQADSVQIAETEMPTVWGSRRVQIQADDRRVWVGTDAGLLRLDRNRREWKQFTEFDGMLGDNVQALLLDEDALWIGTPSGLSRYRWSMDFFD